MTRHEPQFQERENAIVFQIDREYSTGPCPLFAAITASVPLTFGRHCERWQIRSVSPTRKICFGFGFGETLSAALSAAGKAIRQHTANLKSAGSPEKFPQMLKLQLEKLPEASSFADIFPHYQSAAVVRETDRKLAIRAAQSKYGFFIMWDHLYPARDFLLTGQPEKAEKALRFALEYPHLHSFMMVPIQLIPAINEILAFLPDSELPMRYMDFYRRFFHFTSQWCDPETGLVANPLCLAVDFPEQVGLEGMFYEAGMNSMWYNACRVLENFALQIGDADFARETGAMAEKIEKNYSRIFYHPREGFLRMSMKLDHTYPSHELYLYTNTWGLDYIHGIHLFRHLASDLADYQVRKLHHPMGHIFMPVENGLLGRSSTAEHMNQHLGHECLCSRLGNRTDEAKHVLSGYLEFYKKFGNAIETFNYNYCSGDQTQRADWQTFSATAAMQAFIHGIAGLHWHRGGLFFIPANDKGKNQIRNFHFRNHTFDFRCEGSGKFVSSFALNGKPIDGTMQIPADLPGEGKEHIRWNIRRSDQPPVRFCCMHLMPPLPNWFPKKTGCFSG